MDFKDILKCGLILALIAAVSAGLIAGTVSATDPIIKQRAEEKKFAMMSLLLPDADEFEAKTLQDGTEYNVGLLNDQIIGYVIQTTRNGYGGAMTSLIGCDPQGKVLGVQVTEHNETPSIGGEVLKDMQFMSQFIDKTPESNLVFGVNVQGRTSATLTSRAVSENVATALRLFPEILAVTK